MPILTIINRVAVAIYLASGTVLTSLIDNHVISTRDGVLAAVIVTSIGTAFHLGQGAVVLTATGGKSVTPTTPDAGISADGV